jgi:hypothetical protein
MCPAHSAGVGIILYIIIRYIVIFSYMCTRVMMTVTITAACVCDFDVSGS